MNILILSAGRRVALVKGFKNALKKLNIQGNVVAVDLRKDAPALYFADKAHQVKHIEDDGYVDDIISICNKEDIDMVIPIMEREIEILSQKKEYIENSTKSKVILSCKESIEICRNKFKTAKFLEENGFYTPKIITDEDLKNKNYKFPLFIKPLDGVSSINAFKINNEEELNFFKSYIKNPIIQEFIDGEEYGIDVLADFNGNPITIVPMKAITIRAGDYTRGKIIKNRLIIDTTKKLLEALNIIGPIVIDCIVKDDKVYIIEINGRFSTEAPALFEIGDDKAEKLIRLILGEELKYNEDYEEDATFMFYEESIYKLNVDKGKMNI